MKTRTLLIWDRKAIDYIGRFVHVDEGKYREKYKGTYRERYEENEKLRIGLIFDAAKNRVAVFQQVVTSRYDYITTDIMMGSSDCTSEEHVVWARSTDPKNADPPDLLDDAPCKVLNFTDREPTEEDKRMLAEIGWESPTDADRHRYDKEQEDKRMLAEIDWRSPTNADWQAKYMYALIGRGFPTDADKFRYDKEQEAKQRRAEADELFIRLAEKISASRDQVTPMQTKADIKRVRIAIRNGRRGGRPTADNKKLIITSVQDVNARRKNNRYLGMKRACEIAIKEHGLTIKWEALQKHVKSAQSKHFTKKTRKVTN